MPLILHCHVAFLTVFGLSGHCFYLSLCLPVSTRVTACSTVILMTAYLLFVCVRVCVCVSLTVSLSLCVPLTGSHCAWFSQSSMMTAQLKKIDDQMAVGDKPGGYVYCNRICL